MADQEAYAHTRDGAPPEEWQPLAAHLEGVARLAAGFADAFGSGAWGELAGLWHDIGKYQSEFQRLLHREGPGVEHSGAGAALAREADAERGRLLAFALAGHHGGLPDLMSRGHGLPTPLEDRLRGNAEALRRVKGVAARGVMNRRLPPLPEFLQPAGKGDRAGVEAMRRAAEMWVRFLFSALVDADWLDTERFLRPEVAALRHTPESAGSLADRLDSHLDGMVCALPASVAHSPVNAARARVLDSCRQAAALPPGIFSLTVPTGGGKTLSAMSFALRHARRHGLSRVIVVIPYTSIIEQNACIYRDVLGPENVIEHHSNLDPSRVREQVGEEEAGRQELASENWDAPVVVTTSVQFFESLFANRPARCRKLHNVARSVVVLDEVQTLPPGFLLPIVDALNTLVADYGCSVVLSTATPPALRQRPRFDQGLKGVRDIVADPVDLGRRLKRVRYTWPGEQAVPVSWEGLASELAAQDQVLCVVHRRADARTLAEELRKRADPAGVYHLSALMCAEHRFVELGRIRAALGSGEPCRVASTQLVEAGVDVDFPVVYRALAGLDSIVQAAGRCNREGRRGTGEVVVFRAPTAPPAGTLRKGMDTTHALLRECGGALEPDDPAVFERYFRMLYMKEALDAAGIQTNRAHFNFATVARDFKLIEDGFTRTVVVPYGEGGARLAELRRNGPSREALRGLQRYTVSVYGKAFDELSAAGALEEVCEGLFALAPGYEHLYDGFFGLTVGDTPAGNPGRFVV